MAEVRGQLSVAECNCTARTPSVPDILTTIEIPKQREQRHIAFLHIVQVNESDLVTHVQVLRS
eukprot:1316149-Amphidinium_carterae.2